MFNFPVVYLNSNNGHSLLAFGEGDFIRESTKNAFDDLQLFIDQHKGKYIFGFLSYDLKNELEDLSSNNQDRLEVPELFFWVPKNVVQLEKENIHFIQGEKSTESFEFINYFLEEETDQNFHPYNFDFKPRTSKEDYLKNVQKIKDHIQQGDIYELNYCQEFYAENVEINFTLDSYFKLNNITKAPYSSFAQFGKHTILCGSPERYLNKEENKLISEPIKGTSRRGNTPQEDILLKEALYNDPKERSENVMIVDLVRNDLSKIAKKGTVQVEELFGIHTFETVHQMVSKVSCEVDPKTTFTEIIKATFPMGSMTGAPKIKSMELIEKYEDFKRGLFSGSVGYISPNGDFDFNVVIRTLLYNKEKKYLSCSVGGAITNQSDPEKEYEECMIKVQRILNGMNE
jgi:para-aminobenzoate synthetase component 1